MFSLCVESSHARGMGHLFRALNLADRLVARGHRVQFIANDDARSLAILEARGYCADRVDLRDDVSGWQTRLVAEHRLRLWIDDRLDTTAAHARRIKEAGLPLVTFDDRGGGATAADLHVAALALEETEILKGQKILRGLDYLILNPEIARHRRLRIKSESLLVTLGGTDTWGTTVKVVEILADLGRRATVIVGPGFRHHDALAHVLTGDFVVKESVPSLVAEMAEHTLAVTGGGITAFEAQASGLPAVIVANEDFEVPVGRTLEKLGGAVFAGHYGAIDRSVFARELPVETMSRAAMVAVGLQGTDNVVAEIEALRS